MGVGGAPSLPCQSREILLPVLQRGSVFILSTLEVRFEPQDWDKEPRRSGCNALGCLPALFGRQSLDLLIVGGHFGKDCFAVQVVVLRFVRCDGLRRSSGTSGHRGSNNCTNY